MKLKKTVYVIEKIEWWIMMFFSFSLLFSIPILMQFYFKNPNKLTLSTTTLIILRQTGLIAIFLPVFIKKLLLTDKLADFFRNYQFLSKLYYLLLSQFFYMSILGIINIFSMLTLGHENILYAIFAFIISLGVLLFFKPPKENPFL